MPNVGPLEVLVVLIIALVVFGPKRLPELGSSLGKGIREFRNALSGDQPEAGERDAQDGERTAALPDAPSGSKIDKPTAVGDPPAQERDRD